MDSGKNTDSTKNIEAIQSGSTDPKGRGGESEKLLVRRAKALGYDVRYTWLGGRPGSTCLLRGQKLLLLDPQADPAERLEFLKQLFDTAPS